MDAISLEQLLLQVADRERAVMNHVNVRFDFRFSESVLGQRDSGGIVVVDENGSAAWGVHADDPIRHWVLLSCTLGSSNSRRLI